MFYNNFSSNSTTEGTVKLFPFFMHNLLTKLLNKKGIKSTLDMTPEEKQTFENWDKTLSKKELTLEDIKHYCQNQLDIIEGKWKDMGINQAKKAELLPYYTVYKSILNAISSPQAARESLEQYLNQLTT